MSFCSPRLIIHSRSVQTFSTTLDDGSIVLGTLELTEKELTLEVNSQRRAEHGRALLQQVIGGLAREPLVETQTLQHVKASNPSKARPTASLGLSPTEESKNKRSTPHQRHTNIPNTSL